ncbi:3'-5' exonuclease family protein [Halobellus clavatus]|uniref:DNA polymerase III, epsilon subunit n=1 Tax=Halobellus clavatus TaxID=660517 RepID=A0A1H3J0J7_9EURY|nr:hypothetical protein [Halobellus clavatus]SDY33533.1 DNA polymerase III, epsilon subunit [Halobellus clavatus]
MGNLDPIAFDIETSGLEPGAVITVAGLATEMGVWIALNTAERYADTDRLQRGIADEVSANVRLSVFQSEERLLEGIREFSSAAIDGDRHYLTAYNGERWNGGFDLPFLRSACVRQEVVWPFPNLAYADTMDMVGRFYTGDVNDLVGVYEALIGEVDCDPFDDSERAVTTYEEGDWVPLLLHNIADILRTRELAVVAGRYVPKSDFKMKNLNPPDR